MGKHREKRIQVHQHFFFTLAVQWNPLRHDTAGVEALSRHLVIFPGIQIHGKCRAWRWRFGSDHIVHSVRGQQMVSSVLKNNVDLFVVEDVVVF